MPTYKVTAAGLGELAAKAGHNEADLRQEFNQAFHDLAAIVITPANELKIEGDVVTFSLGDGKVSPRGLPELDSYARTYDRKRAEALLEIAHLVVGRLAEAAAGYPHCACAREPSSYGPVHHADTCPRKGVEQQVERVNIAVEVVNAR